MSSMHMDSNPMDRDLLARLLAPFGMSEREVRGLDLGQRASLEILERDVELARHAARIVEVDHQSLSLVSLPALTVLDGSAFAVVHQVRARDVVVEHGGGRRERLDKAAFLERTGRALLEVTPAFPRQGGFLSRVMSFLLWQRRDLLKLGFLSLALTLLGLSAPIITELVMDRALPERTPKLLTIVAIATLLIALQRAFLDWLEKRVALAIETRLEAATARGVFEHLLRIPYASLSRHGVGGWLETLSGAHTVARVFTSSLVLPVMHAVLALVYGTAVAFHDLRVAVFLTLVSLFLLVAALVFARLQSQLEARLIEASARQHSTLFEILSGVATLRACGAQDRGVTRWLSRLIDVRAAAVNMDQLSAWERLLLGGVREIATFGVLFWGASACLQRELTVGGLLALCMLADRYIDVVAGLAHVLTPLSTARTHLARVDALLAQPDASKQRSVAFDLSANHADAVVLDDVWFRYGPDQPWILQGYSLRVPALSSFELRGPSGMGKSTILRLIAGLYTPERGTVRIFGHTPSEVRQQIAYLPQDAHLFEGSVESNLRLLSGAPIEAIHEAAARTGLTEWLDTLPMGFETCLPSGAKNLSGGQRQLIVWTAAMASQRSLLLMDEALSQVDRITRAHLLESAHSVARTTVSVEHDR